MFAFPKPDFNYDSALTMDFVPVHKFVQTERFEKYCDDKENILRLINDGDCKDSQHIHKQFDENNRDEQRLCDKFETALDVNQPAELFQSDSGQSNNSTHNQANKQQEQHFIVDLAASTDDNKHNCYSQRG